MTNTVPDALRVPVQDYPRNIWEGHANFDGLVRFWLERHLGFRVALKQIEAETEGFLAGQSEVPAFARASVRLIGGLLDDLHGHHRVEDMQFFPQLAAMEPRLAAGFNLLEADHQILGGHIDGLATATNEMLRVVQTGTNLLPVGQVLERVQHFRRFIDRHLPDEEDLMIPTILHLTPDWQHCGVTV